MLSANKYDMQFWENDSVLVTQLKKADGDSSKKKMFIFPDNAAAHTL